MSVSLKQAVSRPLGVATNLSGHPIDEAAVYSKIVVLTGEPQVLATANGRWCFLDAMALLSRTVGYLIVVVPPALSSLRREVESYRVRAWSRGSISVLEGILPEQLERATAILNVGAETRPDLPWTSINSSGWVARISSTKPLPNDTVRANPIAALMAAAMGVTEVFKRVFEIPAEVAPLLEPTEFSLWDFATSPTSLGPPLPERMQWVDTLLTGAGAIGNAIALLLAQLRVEGRAHIIDKQEYRDENMGTCVLMEKSGWVNESKALRLATWLKEHSALHVTGDKVAIEKAIAENRMRDLAIDLILNGFDDIDARRETQRLWPSVIVDGGINEVGAAVVQYRLDWHQSACLLCWFETPKADERALQSRWTGLHPGSLTDIGRQLTDQDIEAADASKRGWLRDRQREGKTVCSIITEAQLASQLGVTASEGFRPSVPFVASAAGALVVAAAVKAQCFPEEPAPSMFQIGSLFLGPIYSAPVGRIASSRCHCVTQRRIIDSLRRTRSGNRAAMLKP